MAVLADLIVLSLFMEWKMIFQSFLMVLAVVSSVMGLSLILAQVQSAVSPQSQRATMAIATLQSLLHPKRKWTRVWYLPSLAASSMATRQAASVMCPL